MTILIAIGETEAAASVISTGYELAELYDDTLVALHVMPRDDFEEHKRTIENSKRFQDLSLSQEQDSAARFARRAVRETIPEFDSARVQSRGRVGDPTTEIVAEADDIEPRYLVIGGRRRSPVGKALFGSITQEVLLEARCPVITMITE